MPKYKDGKCPKCQVVVKNDDSSIGCELCEKWYHIKCQGISESELKFIAEHKELNLHWFCLTCDKNFKGVLQELCKLNSRVDIVETKFDDLDLRCNGLESKYDSLEGNYSGLATKCVDLGNKYRGVEKDLTTLSREVKEMTSDILAMKLQMQEPERFLTSCLK